MFINRRFYFRKKADACSHFVFLKITANLLIFSVAYYFKAWKYSLSDGRATTSTHKHQKLLLRKFLALWDKTIVIPPLCIKFFDTRNFQKHQSFSTKLFGNVRQKFLKFLLYGLLKFLLATDGQRRRWPVLSLFLLIGALVILLKYPTISVLSFFPDRWTLYTAFLLPIFASPVLAFTGPLQHIKNQHMRYYRHTIPAKNLRRQKPFRKIDHHAKKFSWYPFTETIFWE